VQWVSKTGALKMQDVKMTDKIAGHEIARHETARCEIAGPENAGSKQLEVLQLATDMYIGETFDVVPTMHYRLFIISDAAQ